jgi:hypothetical protein
MKLRNPTILMTASMLVATARSSFADGTHLREFAIDFAGYGEMAFSYFNYAPNQNRPGGAQRDHRLGFDTTRFSVEMEGRMPAGLEFEAELELEHGGVAVAKEVEFDEFGEVDVDVERGGEANLEELTVKRSVGRFQFGIGRFYVAMGNRYDRYRPTQYLGALRNEAETVMFSTHWAEMGAMATVQWPHVKVTGQIVNGLDSSGFSSKSWVSSGRQGAYETVRASNVAAVARVDFNNGAQQEIGVSGYVGGSNRNRPTTDLVNDCDPNDTTVAPCGYPAGTVAIVDAHARWSWRGVRGQSMASFGHLTGAEAISNRNARLGKDVGVARTPVADNAIALQAELGYDISSVLHVCADNRIEPYAQFNYYDTMFHVRDGLFDNPRFARKLFATGVNYTFKNAVVSKLEVSHRRFGSPSLRSETAVNVTVGFIY